MVSSSEVLEIWKDDKEHYLPSRVSISALSDGDIVVSSQSARIDAVTYEVRVRD